MIGILFILILAWQFYIGYMRSIILQGYYTLASIVSLFIANHFYQKLAAQITLWVPSVNPSQDTVVQFFKDVNLFELDMVFYAGVAFAGVYTLSYFVFRVIGIFLHLINLDQFDSVLMNCISGGLAIFVTLLFFSMGVTLLATVPVNVIQNFLSGHSVTKLLIGFPIFAQLWNYFWVTKIF
ncbi:MULTISPECIES: CvpA family protein [Streptococcus]|uniref:CvpA family protein n=1 Tax=Streptococcus caledonicus TaxID=2614158 RepID=A0ABW0U9C2_9STRE|nr:CvpA family protein [Streptococcus sp. S784/96/1]